MDAYVEETYPHPGAAHDVEGYPGLEEEDYMHPRLEEEDYPRLEEEGHPRLEEEHHSKVLSEDFSSASVHPVPPEELPLQDAAPVSTDQDQRAGSHSGIADDSPLPHVSSPEYPNGNVKLFIEHHKGANEEALRQVGWAINPYGHNPPNKHGVAIWNRSCLGNYQCPVPGCRFSERPRVPRKGRFKHGPPQPAENRCVVHKCDLDHVSCKALLRISQRKREDIDTEKIVIETTFDHEGFHNHAKPHPFRPDFISKTKLIEMVRAAPEIRPKSMQLGTAGRVSVTKIHKAYGHLDRTAAIRRNALKDITPKSTLGSLATWEQQMEQDMIQSSSIGHRVGHICIQTAFMRDRAKSVDCCMQSDSVHGFISDDHFKEINVTFTSIYCQIVRRTIPLVITVLFGKTQFHYERHFLVLFKSLPFKSWKEFEEGFGGMTCDFSEAERLGFESALREHFALDIDKDIGLERYYRFCEVHFKRTLTRVRSNSAYVPHLKEMEFYRDVLGLLEPDRSRESFDVLVTHIRKSYPNAKGWLNWHMHESRGKHIFPAMTEHDFSRLSKDTNAQESLGRDFQQTAIKKKLTIMETLDHSYRYMTSIKWDYNMSLEGMPLRYHPRKKKANVFSNDGRPPDTTKKLLGASTSKTRSSTERIPHSAGESAWEAAAIPWGPQEAEGTFKATNTCPLDTTLMAWYLLEQYSGAVLPQEVLRTKAGVFLRHTMKQIRSGNYDEARLIWCTRVMLKSSEKLLSLWGTMEDAFQKYLPALVRLEMAITSSCTSPLCPEPYRVAQRTVPSFAILEPHAINQVTLEASMVPPMANCTENVEQEKVDKFAEGVFRHQVLTIPGTGDSTEWYECRGTRTSERIIFTTLPYLLVLDALYNARNSRSQVEGPSSVLQIDETIYDLAAIMYGNSSHFRCTVVTKDGAISYDGMGSPKLHRISHNTPLTPPPGYQVNQVWYLRRASKSSVPAAEEHPQLSEVSTPESDNDRGTEQDVDIPGGISEQLNFSRLSTPSEGLDMDWSVSPGKTPRLNPTSPPPSNTSDVYLKRSRSTPVYLEEGDTRTKVCWKMNMATLDGSFRPKDDTEDWLLPLVAHDERPEWRRTSMSPVKERQRKKQKTYYPTGLSAATVANVGKLPTCMACGTAIDRDSNRLVLKSITNRDKGWTSIVFFHFQVSCTSLLTAEQQDQAMQLFAAAI